jgi:plasmid replication initiation protein
MDFTIMSLRKISKSNELVEASYALSLWEQRLVLASLSRLNPKHEISPNVSLTSSEYAELMQIPIKNAHRELYLATEKLYERSVVIKHDDHVEEFRWIQRKAIYHKGEGRVTFTWSDDIVSYISQLERRFTQYRLADVVKLNTSYAIRLYEILMRFNQTNERWIKVDDFRSLLKLEDKYPLFRDLNKWVIKPSVKEINASSNLEVFYSTRKQGRKVVGLQFDFQEKKQQQFNFN